MADRVIPPSAGERPAAGSAETPRDRMVTAALDLLRQGGWWGAGINAVVEASGAPKGSLYHYFPEGKNGLLAAALHKAKLENGEGLRRLFAAPKPLADRIRELFGNGARRVEGSRFTRGCPVAATTLDLGSDSQELQPLCAEVFAHWCQQIADGLGEFAPGERLGIAQWIFATYEGALVLSRAQQNTAPLIEAGNRLAWACTAWAEQGPSAPSQA